MELKSLGTWKQSNTSELFFNDTDRKFFIKDGRRVLVFENGVWVLATELGGFSSISFKKACLSPNNSFFCYLISDSELVSFI